VSGNVESHCVAVLRFERRTAQAELKRPSLTIVFESVEVRSRRLTILQRLNTSAREIILAQRLILRFDLNTAKRRSGCSQPESELMVLVI
jgi:hypothetical protein